MYTTIILFFVFINTITKGEDLNCGIINGGVIIQQITKPQGEVLGLFTDKSGNIYFVDGLKPALCMISTNGTFSRTEIHDIDEIVASLPIKEVSNKLVGVTPKKLIYLDITFNENNEISGVTTEEILTIENDENFQCINAKAEDEGRLWIESVSRYENSQVNGRLYTIDNSKKISKILENNQYPAGMAFSEHDKFFFHADAKENVIYKYKYNEKKGTLENPSVIFNVSNTDYFKGFITAMTIAEESLWIALCKSGTIIEYNWKNEELQQIFLLPAKYITSMVFGGPEGDVLFIGTTSKMDESPVAGAVFAISGTGSKGVIPSRSVDITA